MSTLPDARPPGSPYDDLPLKPGEIRLLTIEETNEPPLRHVYPWMSTKDSMRLTMTRHKLEDKPNFAAVSYVWGTAPTTISLVCNEKQVHVTSVVFELLEHLRRYNQPLWIDAICINQQDDSEKATQIPLMRRIYAQSEFVIVWLGLLPPLALNFMVNFAAVFDMAKKWKPYKRNPWDDHTWRGDGWPPDNDGFWVGFYWLLSHDWFRRLWTFQEVVLAAGVEFVIGPLCINGLELFKFVSDGYYGQAGYALYDSQAASNVPGHRLCSELAWDACHSIKFFRARMLEGTPLQCISELADVNCILSSRQVKEPVDRIWAIVGLLPEALQYHFASMIDHSDLGRREYWRTYVRFAKLVVDIEGNLRILDYPRTIDRDSARLPSWCPDLAKKTASSRIIEGAWNYPVSERPNVKNCFVAGVSDHEECEARRATIYSHPSKFAACFEHDDLLRVRGFVTDRISEVVGDPQIALWHKDYIENSGWDQWTMEPQHAVAMGVLERALTLAQSVYHGQDSIVSDIPIEYLMCLFNDHRISTEMVAGYRDAFAILKGGEYKFNVDWNDRRWDIVYDCRWILCAITGHYFFATEGGRFGIASPGCRPGDRICTLYGGNPLYILRGPEGEPDPDGNIHGNGNAEFCGVTYIPHLMEQHQREAARLADDEIFVIA